MAVRRGRAVIIGLLIFASLAALAQCWRIAAAVATGYTAKQLCSGIAVAGLPADFILEHDVRPTLALMGPLLSGLHFTRNASSGAVTASVPGATTTAYYRPGQGCTLHALPPATRPAATLAATPTAAAPLPTALTPGLTPLLDSAFTEPATQRRKTLAIVVLHQGQIIAERYAAPVTVATPLQGWSMNKSLTATWIGMQVAAGQLSTEDAVRAAAAQADAELAAQLSTGLTLEHLLHMDSGIAFDEYYMPGDDATEMLFRSTSAWRVVATQGQRRPPGEAFRYSSGDTNLAAMMWQQSLGDTPYTEWLQHNFFGPLGITSAVAEGDAQGNQIGSSYLYMTARDWARAGQLWLDAWHGRSALVTQAWQRASTTPRASAADGNYGRCFWLNTQGIRFPALPRNSFWASGNDGQYVVVFPEQELVVVRLGLSEHRSATGIEALLQALYQSTK